MEMEEITKNFLQRWKAGIKVQKFEVIILPLAEKDIMENTDYVFYEKQAPETALALLNGFYDAIKN